MSQLSLCQALTEGPVGSQLIRLTLPMIWGIFAMMAIDLADAYLPQMAQRLGLPTWELVAVERVRLLLQEHESDLA